MMQWVNHHCHTLFSDGHESPKAYVDFAIAKRMPVLGFSDHAPIPFSCDWTMNPENVTAYLDTIQQLKQTYADQIELYTGMEVDYLPTMRTYAEHLSLVQSLDYHIGAVHFVDSFPDGTPWSIDGGSNVFKFGLNQIFGQSIERAVRRYYQLTREMVKHLKPDIVAHLDRIKRNNVNGPIFSESEPWYQEEISKTLEVIQKQGSILEINTKDVRQFGTAMLYPSPWVIEKAYALGIPIHLAADAHHSHLLEDGFPTTLQVIWDAGYRHVHILVHNQWQPIPIDLQMGLILDATHQQPLN